MTVGGATSRQKQELENESHPFTVKSMAAFQLPPEFADGFVSDADTLLKQFFGEQDEADDEAVKVTCHVDGWAALGVQERQILLDTLNERIRNLSQPYIWFIEPLKLSYAAGQAKNSRSSSNVGGDGAAFFGNVKIGDSVEDEWFVVYLVLKLSSEFSTLSFSVTDNDGEFMLIEAADDLPDWLDPSNCTNRIWIRQGKLHIVSLDEPGKRDGVLPIHAALDAITQRPRDTQANGRIQAAIYDRTVHVYPTKAIAHVQRVLCIVSPDVASILQSNQQRISDALNGFYLASSPETNMASANTKSIRQMTASMQRFAPGKHKNNNTRPRSTPINTPFSQYTSQTHPLTNPTYSSS